MDETVVFGHFEWNLEKEQENIRKHSLDFQTACQAFLDKNRVIIQDEKHSAKEERRFCLGKVENAVITVRFTQRKNRIRIIGAGIWRKETKFYEKENKKKS